jgi:hypothetical protein
MPHFPVSFFVFCFLPFQPVGHETSTNTSCFGSSIGQGDNTSSPGVNEACKIAVADGIEVGRCSCIDRDEKLRCIPVETILEDVVVYVVSNLAVVSFFLFCGGATFPTTLVTDGLSWVAGRVPSEALWVGARLRRCRVRVVTELLWCAHGQGLRPSNLAAHVLRLTHQLFATLAVILL